MILQWNMTILLLKSGDFIQTMELLELHDGSNVLNENDVLKTDVMNFVFKMLDFALKLMN